VLGLLRRVYAEIINLVARLSPSPAPSRSDRPSRYHREPDVRNRPGRAESIRSFRTRGPLHTQTEAIDTLLVSALKTRVGELERNARRREWGLATIVALIIGLVVGVVSIMIAHFAFGF
jgi:tetrahydromethanopterin S-methyltransferase subunit F